jgi:hypothetical protein
MDIKETAIGTTVATVKGVLGAVPVVGSLFSEYIGLATELIASKRQKEWQNMVEEKLSEIENDISQIASNDFFFSCVQSATVGALKSYQTEKREIFANALYNSFVMADLAEEKKLIFISLIDKYTLLTIKILKCYSEDNYPKYDYREQRLANPNPKNMVHTTVIHGTEKPLTYLIDEIPELEKEPQLAMTIVTQLANDGLIEAVDFTLPVSPTSTRRKRTTNLGDDFISFIGQDT